MGDNARITLYIGIAGVLIVIAGALWYLTAGGGGTTATTTPNGATTTGATTTPTSAPPTATTTAATSSVKIALLDTEGVSSGRQRGCDRVVLVPYRVATTTAPLTAAMRTLFSLSTTTVGSWYNFIDRTNETLRFDRATVVNGTAHIYLTGSLSGLAGVCDDPRAQIQIEETALQFPTVQRVQIFLNGATTTNLAPSQR